MGRHINPTCLACSRLAQTEAIALHGPGTKTGCWNPKTCPRRRSHYRNRLENNAKQRGTYRARKTTGQSVEVAEAIFVPVQAPPVALLYLFREGRQDAHLHAISASVWQGDRKLAEIQSVHCMGMTNRQVNGYLRNVLDVLGEKFGITEFEPPIRMELSECPMGNCPLKSTLD
ncbi:MAG: hypothetical protein WCD18_25885 [Thermosynechococcaceae cyanobacterium]